MATPTSSTAKMTKNGVLISDRRLTPIDSSLAVTLKVGLRGLRMTDTTAGNRWTVCTYS